jgi:myo-inositol 2-dehydrogenase/D-chiro-inositol 1-dehydrogenase
MGLIGVGPIGVFDASTLGGLPRADSLVITDADLDRAREVADRGRAPTAESVDGLLEVGANPLIIAVSPGAHLDLIKRGVEVPVFCGKPVTCGLPT